MYLRPREALKNLLFLPGFKNFTTTVNDFYTKDSITPSQNRYLKNCTSLFGIPFEEKKKKKR